MFPAGVKVQLTSDAGHCSLTISLPRLFGLCNRHHVVPGQWLVLPNDLGYLPHNLLASLLLSRYVQTAWWLHSLLGCSNQSVMYHLTANEVSAAQTFLISVYRVEVDYIMSVLVADDTFEWHPSGLFSQHSRILPGVYFPVPWRKCCAYFACWSVHWIPFSSLVWKSWYKNSGSVLVILYLPNIALETWALLSL